MCTLSSFLLTHNPCITLVLIRRVWIYERRKHMSAFCNRKKRLWRTFNGSRWRSSRLTPTNSYVSNLDRAVNNTCKNIPLVHNIVNTSLAGLGRLLFRKWRIQSFAKRTRTWCKHCWWRHWQHGTGLCRLPVFILFFIIKTVGFSLYHTISLLASS